MNETTAILINIGFYIALAALAVGLASSLWAYFKPKPDLFAELPVFDFTDAEMAAIDADATNDPESYVRDFSDQDVMAELKELRK